MTDSTAKLRVDISDLKSKMQEAQRAIRLANSEFKASTAGMDKWSSSATGLSAKIKQLNTVLGAQKRQLSLAKEELERVENVYGKNSAEADRARIKVNQYQADVNKSAAQLNKYEKELDDVEKGLKDTGNAAKTSGANAKAGADGFTVMKGALASLVASGIRKAVYGFGQLGKATLAAGVNFEQSMSKLQAVSGASDKKMGQLSAKAKEMGETTKFSASESAEAFNYMAMAGWKTKDMMNGISGVMSLAAASGEDLATTSDIVTDALTAMGYEAGDATKLADVMAAASSNANTNVKMMGETFKYAAPLVGSLGYNMEDTAVAIGLMGNAGIKATQAGTSLRSILSRLASPPKEAASAMEKLGINLKDSQGKMKPLNAVIGEMREKFKGLSETEKAQMASSIAGKNAMSGFLAIVNSSDKDFNKLTKAVNNSEGAAKSMADTMNDNVGGQITLLKSKVEGIMIKVFEAAAPRIRQALDSISKGLDGINWDSVAQKVGSAVQTVANIISFLIRNGNAVIGVLKAIGAAMAITFTVNKISAFTGATSTLVGTFSKVKGAATTMATGVSGAFSKVSASSKLANGASTLLGTGLKMLPWGAAIAGAGALAYGLIKYQESAKKAMLSEYQLSSAQKKTLEAAKQSKTEYDQFNKTRQDSIKASTAEYAHLGELKNEYNSMVGANGKVKKGYEDRANFIKSELASAMGVEASQIDGLIGKNGKLSSSIDAVLKKKQAEAALQANEASYQEALSKQSEELQKYQTAQNEAAEATRKYNEIHAKAKAVMNEYNAIMQRNPEAAERYLRANKGILQQEAAAAKTKKEMAAGLKASEAAYIGYTQTIQNHEALSAAIISGNGKKIASALSNMQSNFVSAKNGTKRILEQQVKDHQASYKSLQAAVKKGMPGVTKAQVAEAKKMVEKSKKELDKFKSKATKAGKDGGKGFANGTSSQSGKSKAAGEKVGKSAEKGAKAGSKGMGKAGKAGGKDYSEGVGSAKEGAKKKGSSVGTAAKSGMSSGSKGMKKTGSKASGDFAAGVGSKKGEASKKGSQVGSGAKKGIESGSKGSKASARTLIDEFLNAITSKKETASEKGKGVGEGAKKGMENGSRGSGSVGSNMGEGFYNGMSEWAQPIAQKAAEIVRNAVKAAKKEGKVKSPSRETMKIGSYFSQGFAIGIEKDGKKSEIAAAGVAKTAINTLKKTQKEHSPSKVTFESGVNFVKGYIQGISSQTNALIRTVQGLMFQVFSAATNLDGISFSEAGQNAATSFSETFAKFANKLMAQAQWVNNEKLAEFDTDIDKYNQQSADEVAAIEAQKQKKVEAIEASRDAAIKANQAAADKEIQAAEDIKDDIMDVYDAGQEAAQAALEARRTAAVKPLEQARDNAIKDTNNKAAKKIKKIEDNRDKAVKKLEKERDAEVNKLTKERDNKIADLNKKLDKAKTKKEKDKIKDKIQSVKNSYAKDIKGIKEIYNLLIDQEKDNANGNIKNIEKSRDAENKKTKDYYDGQIAQQNAYYDQQADALKTQQKKERREYERARQAEVDAVKAKYDAIEASINDSYDKQVKSIEDAHDAMIESVQKKYDELIKATERSKDAYQTASQEMLSELQNALNSYQQRAEKFVQDSINGVSDKYQKAYDDLINRQDSLINKMKSAESLFNLSGANVITLNDINEQTKRIEEYGDRLEQIREKVNEQLYEDITNLDMDQGTAYIDQLLAMTEDELDAYVAAYERKMAAAERIGEQTYKQDFASLPEQYANDMREAFASLPDELEEMGRQALEGFIEGFGFNTDYMTTEIRDYVAAMIHTFKKELGIASPSKVMAKIGAFTGEGFNDGLNSTIKEIQKSVSSIADSVATPLSNIKPDVGSLRAGLGGVNYQNGSAGTVTNNYNLVQNNTSPKSLSALETYQARRRQISMLKAATAL